MYKNAKTIKYVDLSEEKNCQYLVDLEEGQYLGHPDSIILDDGIIYTFYPKGHGKGAIIMKKSRDGGKTWGDRLNTPKSWEDSQETPTIYLIEKSNGRKRLELISGMPRGEGGFRTAYSEDEGETWTEFEHHYPGLLTIVAHSSLTRLKNTDGTWQDRWMGIFHDHKYNNWKTYLTFDGDGSEKWSEPRRLLEEHDDIEKHAGLCEIEIIRSPDGKQLALLARAQHKRTKAMIAFSDDEGETWTKPREMPHVLMGERHKAAYCPISDRLVITFREILRKERQGQEDQWIAGDWCAWVGTYEDLFNNNMGEYYVRLIKEYRGDCGYAGNVVLPDGTFVLTSYGYWDKERDNPYIMTVRLNLSELDRLSQ